MARTKKERILDQFGVPDTDAQRRKDMLAVAVAYLQWRTCGLCERPTIAGYICFHCKEDDSVRDE